MDEPEQPAQRADLDQLRLVATISFAAVLGTVALVGNETLSDRAFRLLTMFQRATDPETESPEPKRRPAKRR